MSQSFRDFGDIAKANGGGNADLYRVFLGLHVLHDLGQLVKFLQNPEGLLKEQVSLRRQNGSVSSADQQRYTGLLLQFRDRLGEGRLGDVKKRGGFGKAAPFADGAKILKLG